jgi:hypothetical protein
MVRDAFISVSSMKFDIKSPLSLVFKMNHPETDMDWEFMTKLSHAKFEVKTKRTRGRVIYQGASTDRISNALKLLKHEDFVAYLRLTQP